MVSNVKRCILVTCGTSILSNVSRYASKCEKLKDLEEKYKISSWARAEPKSKEDEEAGRHAFESSPVFLGLYECLKQDPKGMSAELNTLINYESQKLHYRVTEVYLYYTDTGAGTLCSNLVAKYIREEMKMSVQQVRVEGYGINFEEGISNLVGKIVQITKSKRESGYIVDLLATAGYKPEVTAATIGAMISGASAVYYIHESFKDIVKIPLVPVSIRDDVRRIIEEVSPFESEEKARQKYGDAVVDALLESGILKEKDGRLEVNRWVKKLLSPKSSQVA
ncbi:MAG: putative CRISPR-associated protein [Thermoproteota archaeon]